MRPGCSDRAAGGFWPMKVNMEHAELGISLGWKPMAGDMVVMY
jgi:hypothetical protein